jgi:hypothetical protein
MKKIMFCAMAVLPTVLLCGAEPQDSRLLASFETSNEMSGGKPVAEHATEGGKSLLLTNGSANLAGKFDWRGFDFLTFDTYSVAAKPLPLMVEIRDAQSTGYYTRVNFNTVVPSGSSTMSIPLSSLYVGEKAKPGRALNLAAVTRLALSIGDKSADRVYIDNLRLQRDPMIRGLLFEGLHAFDFGTEHSPVLEGFSQITHATTYKSERGYGLKSIKGAKEIDCLQPDPLYQDAICIESGGLAVDVPNGRYRVMVNIDGAPQYWGNYQTYERRTVLAEGRPVVQETCDFERQKQRYFRFWISEDSPLDNAFEKYVKPAFNEKTFDVDVNDGQLNLEFTGNDTACCVSTVIIFPTEKAMQGETFLKAVKVRRKFHFENNFHRIPHQPTGDSLAPTQSDIQRGCVTFSRHYMKDVYYNDTPLKGEIDKAIIGEGFPGEIEPLNLCIVPLRDLGKPQMECSALTGPGGTIPSNCIELNWISYRLSRSVADGSIYTIAPRYLMPCSICPLTLTKDITRRFWLVLHTPDNAKPGLYKGALTIHPEKGEAINVPIEFTVHCGNLDRIDVPAGPFSYDPAIKLPWNGAEAEQWREAVSQKCWRKMAEYGFTMCSSFPVPIYDGFKDGKPLLNFSHADARMKLAKELGFLSVLGTPRGFNAYYQDTEAMTKAGFKDYTEFIRTIYSEIQKHANEHQWLPVVYRIGDEPHGNNLNRSCENAESYRRAFPDDSITFTVDTSFQAKGKTVKEIEGDLQFRLCKALTAATLGHYDAEGVNLIRKAGRGWGAYNGQSRYRFGPFLFKAVKEYDCKFYYTWHFNVAAGDPYYPLDCREDDYCWVNVSPSGDLIPSLSFEQNREGIDDYRYMLTLKRLCKENAGSPTAQTGEALLTSILAGIQLESTGPGAPEAIHDWESFRHQLALAIDAVRNSAKKEN